MKTTTNYALPYPESGDHTRTWEYWQGLADAVDALLYNKFLSVNADGSIRTPGSTRPVPYAWAALKVTGQVTAATFTVQAFTFPAGRFSVAPVLAVTSETWPYNAIIYGAPTASGGNAAWIHNDSTSGTQAVTAHLHAVQMTPSAAVGLAALAEVQAAPGMKDVVATCHTAGCLNEGIPITVSVLTTDPMGNPYEASVCCGVCGQLCAVVDA